MDGQHNPPKSELKFLERLSIEELEALLKFSGDPNDVELLFDTVIEEVVAREEKNPTGRLPDVDTAWDEFQTMYNSLDRETLPTFSEEEEVLPNLSHGPETPAAQAKDRPKRVSFRRVARTAVAMAAAIAFCLGLMVGVQAAGTDVFGALARWTDDTFHFETTPNEQSYCDTLHDTIQGILSNQGVVGEYAPKWYPEGFDIANSMIMEDELGVSIRILLSNETEDSIAISVDQYKQKGLVDSQIFEIEAETVEEYPSNGKLYYIFANEDSITATWSDGKILQKIWGELTLQEFKIIIDSIGE